jgi:MFS transporter, SP family, galactose:H+ symporter
VPPTRTYARSLLPVDQVQGRLSQSNPAYGAHYREHQHTDLVSRFVVLAAAVAAIGGSLAGYDTGVVAGAILFIRPAFGLSTGLVELVVGAALIGATIGAIASARLTDALGRRAVLLAAAVCFAAGSIGSALAPGVPPLVAARVLIGLAIGVGSYAVPLYISELAPPQSRGWLVSLNQLAIAVGILIAYGVDYAFSMSSAWRLMLGLAVVPSVLLFAGVALLPDTPRWLVRNGQADAARQVLLRLRRPDRVDQELADIESIVLTRTCGWSELLAPTLRIGMVVGIGLAIFQQVTGINTVIYYAPIIIQLASIPSASGAILATTGIGAVIVLMTVVSLFLLDRVGRRPLLLAGLMVMGVALVMLGLAFMLSGLFANLRVASVVWLMIYGGAFAISLGPIFCLLVAEIYPLRVRGLAMGVALAVNWAANLLVSLTFLTLLDVLGPSLTFWLYALLCVVALIFVYKLVPETKGRTLEAIERFWRRSDELHHTVSGAEADARDRAA